MGAASFAEELRELLAGEDVAALAADLGVSERAVRSWARGERSTSPEVVFALEQRLGVPPGALSRHLGYRPLARGEAWDIAASRVASRVAEQAGRYRAQAPEGTERLLDRVDEEAAARRGLQLELLRIAVEDFESEHGALTAEEIERARQELTGELGTSATA
jgi:transcriptional regulator with XRE-family HTH domain